MKDAPIGYSSHGSSSKSNTGIYLLGDCKAWYANIRGKRALLLQPRNQGNEDCETCIQ